MHAHGPWGLVDGVAAAPTLARGNAPVTIARQGTGTYRLTFPYAIDHFLATSQTRGPLGDAPSTLVSVIRNAGNPRQLDVIVYGVTNGSAANTTHLVRMDAWFSFELRR
jgi:hypothetical protein